MLVTRGLLMSWMRSRTFAWRPWSARQRVRGPAFSGGATPPQSTRCSGGRISPLPKLGPHLPERDRREPAHRVRCQPVALVDVPPVPSAGKRLDDAGRLAAVPPEGLVEPRARRVIREAL